MEKLYQGLLKFSLEEFELFVELLDLEYPSESERVVFLANFISFIPTQSLYAKHIEILLNRYPSLALPLHVEFCNFLMLSKATSGNDLTYSHAILSNQTIEFKYFFGQVFNCIYKQDITTLKSLVSAENPEHLVQIGAYEFISFFSGYFNDKTVLEAFEDNANLSFFREGLDLGGHNSLVDQVIELNSRSSSEPRTFKKNLFDWQNFARGEQKPENKSVAVKIADLLRKFGASNSNQIDLFGVDRIYFEAGFALATLIKKESEIYDLKSTGLVHAVSESLISEFLLGIGSGFKDKDESLLKYFRKAYEQTILDVFISEIKSRGITSDAEDLFNDFDLVDFKQTHEFYIEYLTQQDPKDFDAKVHGDHIIQIYSKNPACLLNFVSEIVNIDQDFSKNLVREIKNDIEELQIEASNLMDDDGDSLAKKFEEIKELEKLSQKLESKLKRKNLGKRSHQDVVAETSQPVTISFQIGEEQITKICVDTCKPQAKRPKLFEDDMEEVYRDVMRSNPFNCQMLYDLGGLKYYLLNPNPQIHEEVLDFCRKNLSAANIEEIGSLINIDLLENSKDRTLALEVLTLVVFCIIIEYEEKNNFENEGIKNIKQNLFDKLDNTNKFLFIVLLASNQNPFPLNFDCKEDYLLYSEIIIREVSIDLHNIYQDFDKRGLKSLITELLANYMNLISPEIIKNHPKNFILLTTLIKIYGASVSEIFDYYQKSELTEDLPEAYAYLFYSVQRHRLFNIDQLNDIVKIFAQQRNLETCSKEFYPNEWNFIDAIISDMIEIEKDPSKAENLLVRKIEDVNSYAEVKDMTLAFKKVQFKAISMVAKLIESAFEAYPTELACQILDRKSKYETFLQNLELTACYTGAAPNKKDYALAMKSCISNLNLFVQNETELAEIKDLLNFTARVFDR